MIGATISHYKILEKLGEGGMGVVYKAHDTKLDRMIALKFLPHHLTANEAEKARFLQEAKAAAQINHPNVCSIIDIQEYNGDQFIVMELVDGQTLRTKIQDAGLKIQEAVSYAIQIGEALHEAHSKGIVHRDIKCENIMVNARNQIKVMDFGLAKLKGSLKLTRTSSTIGTLAYMAPEQIQGGDVDHRSDIFSLGVVLFEMLTGHMPFRGEHDAAMMYSIVNEEPESIHKYRQEVSAEVERIVRRALEKEPEDRYQSVADMVSELRREQKKSSRVIRPDASSAPVSISSPSQQSGSVESTISPKEKTNALLFGVGGFLLVAIAVLLYVVLSGQDTIDSLAVLPFEDVGASPDQEYLADGVTESIINNLTKISSLRVVPRSTVFRFKGKGNDIQEVGKQLKVGAVLSGRITHRGQMLDVQVDLIDIQKESQLWGNLYQVSSDGLLSLQEKITTDVSSKLGLTVSEETKEKLVKRATENTQAYQLYLQGRYYWNKRNAVAIERAIDYFKQAISLDSTYALAYAGLADCYIIQSQYAGLPTSVTIPLTETTARKALALDNSLAEAHTTLAFSYFEQWKFEEAEKEFKRAIELNPRYPTAYHWYNILLVRLGRVDEAEQIIKKGYELDPFSPIITLNVGAIPLLRQQYDAALLYFKKCIELDPSFAPGYGWLGVTYARMKNYPEAISQIQKAVELSGRSSEYVGYLGYVLGKSGKKDEALKLVNENEENYRLGKGAAYNIARVYAGLGDKEKVIQWLERDFQDHSTWINSLISDFVWEDFKTDSRFIEMTRKMGLVK